MDKITLKKKGYLVLASGRVFEGWAFGATSSKKSSGEVVFNTSLTGYQEILTDPSYHGQIVVMTPSHIGNTGINAKDWESRKIFLSGFVVQELSQVVSNWRSEIDLPTYLEKQDVFGLTGVDTRALTKHVRAQGAVNGILGTEDTPLELLVKQAQALHSLEGQNLVDSVTTDKPYDWTEGSGQWSTWNTPENSRTTVHPKGQKKKVVVMDFGVKQNILRCLVDLQCEVKVVPASTSASDMLNHKPDGILLSNGPGDPAMVKNSIQAIRDLLDINQKKLAKSEPQIPIFGICLGHQLLGLAFGGETFKLKFGHHGANHPVKDLENNQVEISSQNHGFALKAEKGNNDSYYLAGNKDVKITHINLNDNAVEGLRHTKLAAFSLQYHPEASAGPHDSRIHFERFINLMNEN